MSSLLFEHLLSRSRHQVNALHISNACRLGAASPSLFPSLFIAMSVGALRMECLDVRIVSVNQLTSLSTLPTNSLARSQLFDVLDYLPSKSHGLPFPSRPQIGNASMTFVQSSQMPTISSNTSHMNFGPLFGARSLHSKNSKRAGRPSATHQDTCFTRMQSIAASRKLASITVSSTRSLHISLPLVCSFYSYKLTATYSISASPTPVLQT